jgi:sugar/nucleoside kinase (ribokinase family)
MPTLVVGDANADLTALLSRFPAEGDDSPVSSLAWGSGGSAANVAAALARLGRPSRLLARVGRDPAAEIALRAARAAGVDLASVQVDDALATGLCYAAISPGGERTFFSYRGANRAMQPPGQAALADVDWIHVAGHALLEDAQAASTSALLASSQHTATLDLCLPLLRGRRVHIQALLPRFAVLFANERELCALADPHEHAPDDTEALLRLCRAARSMAGVGILVVKCGARGCIVAGEDGARPLPAFAVEAVDTNGCGDAFVAGFLDAAQRGCSPGECALRGNALGALAATRYGAAEGLPGHADLEAFLAERT